MGETLRLAGVIGGLTIAAGVLDSLAFTYSASVWQGGRIVWSVLSKAAISFALGITFYWWAIRYLGEAGIVWPEIQTLVWFSVTIIGVTALSGRFLSWSTTDQLLAANVFVSLGWLITRTST